MNVWKIASRWSNDGNAESSILDLFRKYKIAFVYDDKYKLKNELKKGDLLALSDGFKIIAVAQALENSCSITDIEIENEDKNKFEYSDKVSAVKLNLYDLEANDFFEYKKIGRFHKLPNHFEQIKRLYEKYHSYNIGNKFSINANTYTFKGNKLETSIINNNTKYIIPIYQRPYSWGENEVSKFIQDIFISFWGYEKEIENQEPMFIGTMQLSELKSDNKQYIIDGQQRISTFCLLIKYLQLKVNNVDEILNIDLKSLLKTEVNNGTQQALYEDCITLINFEKIDAEKFTNNRYVENLKTIMSVFEEQIENHEKTFDHEEFIDHLFTNIYFVIIETRSGLSKTIQIFNAINTTGLDLNGGDIFKVRMYEYLTTKKNEKEECFNRISKLYEKIDVLNQKYKVNFSINHMLYEYRDILVSKYDMPNVLFELNQNTFFDRLFDTILGNQKWENFSKANDIELSIEDIDTLIDNRYQWQEEWENFENQTKCSYRFIWHSRYSKYWNIIFVYWFKNGKVEINKLNKLIVELNKLFFLYSISFDRSIGHIKSYVYQLYKSIYNTNELNLINDINKKLKENVPYEKGEPKHVLKKVLSSDIFSNAKKKNLICRLSAMLEGDTDEKMLFFEPIDIEHIQPQTDNSENAVKWDWHLKNSLGNLVILERCLNRGIGNNSDKKEVAYKESKYKIVRKLSNEQDYSFANWNVDECKKRLEIESRKILDYIFD